jgi:hypothetical protein
LEFLTLKIKLQALFPSPFLQLWLSTIVAIFRRNRQIQSPKHSQQPNSDNLKMRAAHSSKTWEHSCYATRCKNPEGYLLKLSKKLFCIVRLLYLLLILISC